MNRDYMLKKIKPTKYTQEQLNSNRYVIGLCTCSPVNYGVVMDKTEIEPDKEGFYCCQCANCGEIVRVYSRFATSEIIRAYTEVKGVLGD